MVIVSLSYVSGINECANATLNKCTPSNTCRNTVTSFRCECAPGFRLKDDKYTCVGEWELAWKKNVWKMKCRFPWWITATLMILFPRFTEIDECKEFFPQACAQKCSNRVGSYSCECDQNFDLFNGTQCKYKGRVCCDWYRTELERKKSKRRLAE